jgi:hypothetical protein
LGAPAVSAASADGDARITAEREETKHLISVEHIDPLVVEIRKAMTAHRFTGEGANKLPDPQHFVTTIYFDTPSRQHFRLALSDAEHNVKLRAKEYYDLHPSLAELATDPSQIVQFSPWVWFEIKRRTGSRSMKRRFRLPKRDVPSVFEGGELSAQALSLEASRDESLQGAREMAAYSRSLGEPLTADCLVNYRRLSWQVPDGSLRVTLDLGLSYYPAPADLWTRSTSLLRANLGRASGVEPFAVLEVKRLAPLPEWLERALARTQAAPTPFSKFVAAGKAVHGTA